MGQMFDRTCNQMNNSRRDNPSSFEDQVDQCNPQTTSSGKVKSPGECFSWYGRDDLRAKIVPPNCRQYKPGDVLAVRPLNRDEMINHDYDDENWVHPGVPSGGKNHPSDGNDNNHGEGEEDMQGCEKGTGKEKGTKDGEEKGTRTGKGKAKPMDEGKGMGHSKGKHNVIQTPGGDDISRAVTFQLQKDMYEADLDTEG